MTEPALLNETSFNCSLFPILDRHGQHCRLAIVKATFVIIPGEQLRLSGQQRDPRLGDEPWGDPRIPDIRLPADFCAAKPGTDFVVSGHAVPPNHYRGNFLDVHIKAADREMSLRVHGARKWQRGVAGVAPGAAQSMIPTPLAWSLAYGGIDLSDPAHPLEEARNPVGRGVTRNSGNLIDQFAPQIEAPNDPVLSANAKTTPVGCAAIGRNFVPRRYSAGTYSNNYVSKTYPARPTDYQEEHENCAAPEFVFSDPLRGGEAIMLAGLNAQCSIHFLLPKWRILIEGEIDQAVIAHRPHLDTVVANSDAMELELVWRALFRCPTKMQRRFTAVRVRAKEYLT